MKTTSALAASAVAFVITLSSAPMIGRTSTAHDEAALLPAYQITRSSDAAASCKALIAEIEQISTEVQLRSVAQTDAARSLVANRRSLHLAAMLRQRSCASGQAIATI